MHSLSLIHIYIKKYTDEMVIETEIDVGTTMRLKVYTQNQPSA